MQKILRFWSLRPRYLISFFYYFLLFWQKYLIFYANINTLNTANIQSLNHVCALYWVSIAFFSLQTKKQSLRFNFYICNLNCLFAVTVSFCSKNVRFCAWAPLLSWILRLADKGKICACQLCLRAWYNLHCPHAFRVESKYDIYTCYGNNWFPRIICSPSPHHFIKYSV